MSSWRSAAGIAPCSICRRSGSRRACGKRETRRWSSMSSLDGKAEQRDGELPPALSSMWRLCKLGYQHEPALMLVAFVLSLLSALPDALIAVWLKLLGDGVLGHRRGLVLASAIGLGVSATATWFLRTVSTR